MSVEVPSTDPHPSCRRNGLLLERPHVQRSFLCLECMNIRWAGHRRALLQDWKPDSSLRGKATLVLECIQAQDNCWGGCSQSKLNLIASAGAVEFDANSSRHRPLIALAAAAASDPGTSAHQRFLGIQVADRGITRQDARLKGPVYLAVRGN